MIVYIRRLIVYNKILCNIFFQCYYFKFNIDDIMLYLLLLI